LENSCHELSASHDKIQNENKVLKKVLAIKQERQDQFVAELENARRYKEQAEHLIAVLRQHLQTQQSYDNNIIGYADGGPPPNVF
jgi:flagellar biosynthesis chaperone FliJ